MELRAIGIVLRGASIAYRRWLAKSSELPWLGELSQFHYFDHFRMASEGGSTCIHRAYIKLSIVLALTSVTLFTTSVFGQSPATRPNSTDKGIAAQGSRLGNPENKVAASEPKPGSAENKVAADEPKPKDLQSEVDAMKAENAAGSRTASQDGGAAEDTA